MIVAGAASASAAIIYTDSPDQTFFANGAGLSGIQLDLNTNGTNDFGLMIDASVNTAAGYERRTIYIETVGNSASWATDSYGALVMNSNFLVTSTLGWSNGTERNLATAGTNGDGGKWAQGNFLGRNRKMIGVSFNIAGSQHYGWIRVSVDKKARSFTVHDYAYSDIPTGPVFTGRHLDQSLEGTVGSRVELPAAIVDGAGATFAKAPKVVGYYFDPVKGKKTAKATFKATLNGDGSIAFLDMKKKVRLSDIKALKSGYKRGYTCHYFLVHFHQPNQGMNFDLEVTLPDKTVVPAVAQLALQPPMLGPVSLPGPGAVVTIDGNWFGVKPPKAWVEYHVQGSHNIVTKILKLKVVKNFIFADAKGKPSCMNVDTGVSQFQVQFPEVWPPVDYESISTDHNLVIDNGVGLAYQALP
jgi:hypothetical protein